MTVTITIDCDNAAFEAHADLEVVRILRDLARRIDDGEGTPLGTSAYPLSLRDINGNTVGTMEVSE